MLSVLYKIYDYLLHDLGQHLILEKKCSIKKKKDEAEPHTIWKLSSKPFIYNAQEM